MVNKFLKKYGLTRLPHELASVINSDIEQSEKRKLTLEEIISANEEFAVDFTEQRLIPVIDVYDNDFICYQIENGKWCVFNICEEFAFKKNSELQDYLNLNHKKRAPRSFLFCFTYN